MNELHINPIFCRQVTPFTFDQLVSLTGIFGIHSKEEYDFLLANGDLKISALKMKSVIEIVITSPKIEFLYNKIDYYNWILFKLEFKPNFFNEKNYEFEIFQKQVEAARQLNFKKIIGKAKGKVKSGNKDYINYAEYGFVWSDPTKEFEDLLKSKGIFEIPSDLYEMISTSIGKSTWNAIGEEWLGEFALEDNSPSMHRFNKYCSKYNRESGTLKLRF